MDLVESADFKGAPQGSILIMTMALVILLVSLVGGFLYAVSVFVNNSGWEETDAKVLWLAEAGLQKAIWNLKTPTGSGGQGENWTTAGTTENLGGGSYTMVVSRYDFALAANGGTASASSSNGVNVSSRANDGNDTTFWESASAPSTSAPQTITIAFPYTLNLNKARFLSSTSANVPRDYTWQVSSDNSTYTTIKTVTGNTCTNRTDTFTTQSNVNYLRLRVTRSNTSSARVRVYTLEALGSKITSTGTMTTGGNTLTRTVVQTVVAMDGVTIPTCSTVTTPAVAYYEPDWVEQ